MKGPLILSVTRTGQASKRGRSLGRPWPGDWMTFWPWSLDASATGEARQLRRGSTPNHPAGQNRLKADNNTWKQGSRAVKHRLGRKYLWSLFLCFFFNLVSFGRGMEKQKKAMVWLRVCTASCVFWTASGYFSSECGCDWFVRLCERMLLCEFLFPIVSSGRSASLLLPLLLLLLPPLSPASASRTEACKDMHAFILTWAQECVDSPVWGSFLCLVSACWCRAETNHSISTSNFAQLVDLSPFFASVSFY